MARPAPILTLFPLAIAGSLAVHGLAYLVAHPDPRLRSAALDGHGYLGAVAALAIPLATIGVLGLAVRSARRLDAVLSIRRLALVQTIVFVTQEVLERLPGERLDELLREPAVLVGLALQVPIAAAAVAMVRLGRRVADTARAADLAIGAPWPRPVLLVARPRLAVAAVDRPSPIRRRGPPRSPRP